MPDFVHLHNHTHYSLLDAACTVKQLVGAAKDCGHQALALTDHGVMFGIMEFLHVAGKEGIKPLIGFEAYVANGSRFDNSAGKQKSKRKNYFHLVLLAKNETGYKNLMKLTSAGHLEGYYYKPRIDEELIEKYHEGVIALSACIAGVVSSPLVDGNYDEAFAKAQFYQRVFGDDFYIELQRHKLAEDEIIMRDAPKIARELGIKLIATNDVHYIKQEHAIAHNVMLNIKDVKGDSGSKIDIYDLRYRTPEMYYKTTEQMVELFKDYPDSIENTLEVADKCQFEMKKQLFMPVFAIPKESKSETLEDYLEELTYKGLNKRFSEITEEIQKRVEYELDVIKSMKFAGYFLIVQDFVIAAKRLGCRVGPGRGSAAGSLVAYALEITDINPLPFNLLFERFLNPERYTMPDIDIDFSDEKRELAIKYVKEKYGEASVAQIITFGKLSSRAVLKDVGRVLGIHHSEINNITSKIPVEMGKVRALEEAIELPDLKPLLNSNDKLTKQLIEYSLLLEGFFKNSSTHAAGVVIAPGPVSDYVPLYSTPKEKSQGNETVTQYSMADLESAGLLKMDFLGLRTLSIIDNSLALIKQTHGIDVDIDKIDFSDEETYQMFGNGNTLAIFQFESSGMQEYLKQLKPHNLEEIAAMNALYRPGPMKNIQEFIDRKFGKKEITYLVPIMQKSLENTYGIIVYQEQVMQLARDIAGYSFGQADILRRIMGKKKKEDMEKQKGPFLEGAKANDINAKDAMAIFELIQEFASYGFNKSHSVAYSYLAYQTAWLKTHYTAEFLAANMSAELNDLNKIVQLIEEAKKFGIKLLPPNINKSMPTFSVLNNDIIFGLAALKNVGISAVESILEVRQEKPFTSFFNFASRIDTKQVNKRSLESLVCAGAFDEIENNRRASLYCSIEQALEYAKACQDKNKIQLDDLFGGSEDVGFVEPKMTEVEEWSEKERLEKEKEVMNFYLSGHPLQRYQNILGNMANLQLGDMESPLIGESVRVCGLITQIRTRLDKRNRTIAFVMLEDFSGRAECIFWNDAYEKCKDYLEEDNVVIVCGKSENESDVMKIFADQVMTVDEGLQRFCSGYNIWIDRGNFNEENLNKLQSLCSDINSKNTIVFHVFDGNNGYRNRYISYNNNIPISNSCLNKLYEIFGQNNVKFIFG